MDAEGRGPIAGSEKRGGEKPMANIEDSFRKLSFKGRGGKLVTNR